MRTSNPHLIADVELDDVTTALCKWRWLFDGNWLPLLVSAVGDVFLVSPAGEVARLDTGTATLERVAESREDFEAALGDPAIVADWFLQPVVEELRAQGKRLGRGECYGFTILPIFKEGDYGAGNRYCLSAVEHIRYTGDIHLQLKDVPDGASADLQIVDRRV